MVVGLIRERSNRSRNDSWKFRILQWKITLSARAFMQRQRYASARYLCPADLDRCSAAYHADIWVLVHKLSQNGHFVGQIVLPYITDPVFYCACLRIECQPPIVTLTKLLLLHLCSARKTHLSGMAGKPSATSVSTGTSKPSDRHAVCNAGTRQSERVHVRIGVSGETRMATE